MNILHLVVGPDQHGVVLHGTQIAEACGHRLERVRAGDPWPPIGGAEVVHVPFTDRLFGSNTRSASTAFRSLRDHVARHHAMLSVTVHDVPHDSSPLQRHRLELYREVVSAARGVVVNSLVELGLIEAHAEDVHSLRNIALPVIDAPLTAHRHVAPREAPTVAVLGFVFPDRGYEDVIAALPASARLVALGRPSDGHEDLPDRLAALAEGRWSITGYLADADLATHLRTAGVPVAPNRRVTASASINTWIAHGRRPLVPDSPYSREIDRARPGTVTIYDADDPDGLRRAIETVVHDPASSWLAPGVERGPGLAEVAAAYRRHLLACSAQRPIEVATATVVPGNRWDLLTGHDAPRHRVSVVVPYFEAQRQLDRTLLGLSRQTYPADLVDVVVADDGSAQPPDVTCAGDVAVHVVRQDDRGFRAAAARNLGASIAAGDVLVFLDADTVPEPEFLTQLTRLPAVCPDVLAVGRRRHADLSADPVIPLPEPSWLRDGYRASRNLLDADARSYRFVISAVLAVSRRLFDDLGGFDERFVGYGGEDWELAHRAWVAGAVFAHVPEAVGWHDGPDWAGRVASTTAAKNDETLALAALLPDPVERGGGQWLPYPAVVLRAGTRCAADVLATARSAFASGADVGIWLDAVTGAHAASVLADPRLHLGDPPPDVLARAGFTVELTAAGAVDLTSLPVLCSVAERRGEVVSPALRVRSAHAANRARRWWPDDADAWSARLFGHHDRSSPVCVAHIDLAAGLRRSRPVSAP